MKIMNYSNIQLNFCSSTYQSQINSIENPVIDLYKNKASMQEICKTTYLSRKMTKAIINNFTPKPTTKEKYQILAELPKEEVTPEIIKDIFKTTISRANGIYSKFKEPPNVTKRNELCKQILKMKSEGLTYQEIAKTINKSKYTIKNYIKLGKQLGLDVIV